MLFEENRSKWLLLKILLNYIRFVFILNIYRDLLKGKNRVIYNEAESLGMKLVGNDALGDFFLTIEFLHSFPRQ